MKTIKVNFCASTTFKDHYLCYYNVIIWAVQLTDSSTKKSNKKRVSFSAVYVVKHLTFGQPADLVSELYFNNNRSSLFGALKAHFGL